MKYNVEFFAEGLNQQQNDELFALLKKFSNEGAFVSGCRDKTQKEPETVHGNEAEKEVCPKCTGGNIGTANGKHFCFDCQTWI